MSENTERAKELFRSGYNCSQAVFAAFSEELGLEFDTALKISSSFGAGMGRLREVCGAVTGMFMVAGMKNDSTDPMDKKAKTEHYKRIQAMAKSFEQKNGSIVCRELLGLSIKKDNPTPEDRTEKYYKRRPCGKLVEDAVKILDDYFYNG